MSSDYSRRRNQKGNAPVKKYSKKQRRSRKKKPEPLTFWQKLGLFLRAGSSGKQVTASKSSGKKETKKRLIKPRKFVVPRLYVGNLSYEATEQDLEELFKGIGKIKEVGIIYDRRTQRSKGYGFVEFVEIDEAKRGVEVLNDQLFMGRELVVSPAKERTDSQ